MREHYIHKMINNIQNKKSHSLLILSIPCIMIDIFIIPTSTHTICKICYKLSLQTSSTTRFGECWPSARRQ